MSIVPGYPVCKPASIKWMISLAEGTTLILIQGQREGSDLLVFFLLPVLHPLYPSLLPMLCWLSLMSGSAKEKTVIKTWQLIRDVLKRYLLQGEKNTWEAWEWEWGSSLHLFVLWLSTTQGRAAVPQGNGAAIWGAAYSSSVRVKDSAPHTHLYIKIYKWCRLLFC